MPHCTDYHRPMADPDPTQRFGTRAAAYARGRPGYPAALAPLLTSIGIGPGARVADLGAGTGQSTELLLATGADVVAIEPNPAMRAHLVARFAATPRFTAVDGSAEATTLPAASLDHAVAMQAFHWFDVERTRAELTRTLRPGAQVVLIWNSRADANPFMHELEQLFRRFAPDYDRLGHVGPQRLARIDAYFRAAPRHVALTHQHPIDRAALHDYIASVSYLPAGDPALLAATDALLDRHPATRALDYVTDVYLGAP